MVMSLEPREVQFNPGIILSHNKYIMIGAKSPKTIPVLDNNTVITNEVSITLLSRSGVVQAAKHLLSARKIGFTPNLFSANVLQKSAN